MLKLVLTYSLSSFFFGLFGVSWDAIDRKIDREYPQIPFITSDSLQQKLQESAPQLVIIDVREAEEFAVSHLETALNIQTGDGVAEQIDAKDTPIVVYCSVGYRSAGVAARLQELGYSNVSNLRHSIFNWAERGYPLANKLGSTDKIHPFNTAWGSLVDSDLHAYEPE